MTSEISKVNLSTDDLKVLKYLIKIKDEDSDEISFGTNRYKHVPGMAPEEVVLSLLHLQECGLCRLEFTGPASSKSLCFITMTVAGLDYLDARGNLAFFGGASWVVKFIVWLLSVIIAAYIGARINTWFA